LDRGLESVQQMIGILTLGLILETPELPKEPVDVCAIARIDENGRLERYGLFDHGKSLLDGVREIDLRMYGMLEVKLNPETGNSQHIGTLAAAFLKVLLAYPEGEIAVVAASNRLAVGRDLFQLASLEPLGRLAVEGGNGEPAWRIIAIEPAQEGKGL